MSNRLVDQVVSRIVKEAGMFKSAHVFDPGDIVILVDQVQGLNKGTKYKVMSVAPGKITIAALNITDGKEGEPGEVLGEFASDRFTKHDNNY
jgi:hypothetical protein